jgi:hypothetical protein
MGEEANALQLFSDESPEVAQVSGDELLSIVQIVENLDQRHAGVPTDMSILLGTHNLTLGRSSLV